MKNGDHNFQGTKKGVLVSYYPEKWKKMTGYKIWSLHLTDLGSTENSYASPTSLGSYGKDQPMLFQSEVICL